MEGKDVTNRSAKSSFYSVPGDSAADTLGNREAHSSELEPIRKDLQRETGTGDTTASSGAQEVCALFQPFNPKPVYADKRFRPFERRAARTLRPPTVPLRAK